MQNLKIPISKTHLPLSSLSTSSFPLWQFLPGSSCCLPLSLWRELLYLICIFYPPFSHIRTGCVTSIYWSLLLILWSKLDLLQHLLGFVLLIHWSSACRIFEQWYSKSVILYFYTFELFKVVHRLVGHSVVTFDICHKTESEFGTMVTSSSKSFWDIPTNQDIENNLSYMHTVLIESEPFTVPAS